MTHVRAQNNLTTWTYFTILFRRGVSLSKKTILENLKQAVINFEYNEIEDFVKNALKSDLKPDEVIEVLREGLKIVGENYQNGTYFLSELYLASETMNRALNTLKPHLNPKKGDTSTGKAVIGSIQGDIHDFGKTIIASLLNAVGVEIYDVGIDVPPEKFVSEAIRVDASIIGISALLSTTQPLSKKVVDILRSKGLRDKFKVILGGSGVDPVAAVERFGVDAAVNDGAEGIEIILSWIRGGDEV